MRVSIEYAQAHLSQLIDRAVRGEEIIICRGSIPRLRLVPITSPKPKKRLSSRWPPPFTLTFSPPAA